MKAGFTPRYHRTTAASPAVAIQQARGAHTINRWHAGRASSTRSTCCHAAAKTLYELLGVDTNVTTAQLKHAYRSLAAIYHPDINKSSQAAQKFQAINQAYEVLRDDQLRRHYDTLGLKALGSKYDPLWQYFQGSSGGSVSSAVGQRGRDVHEVVGLEFTESVTGVEKVVEVEVQGVCDQCEGTGKQGGHRVSSTTDCTVCHGAGEILRSVWQPSGIKITQLGVCPACGGTGQQAQAFCSKCGGEGRSAVLRRVSVRIPAGVDSQSVLRVKGCGHAGRCGGEPGDLMLRFKVHDEPHMERRGSHLYSKVQCGLWQAMLGCSLHVRSARGQRQLQVPAGSQHGDLLQLPNAGIATVGSNGGLEYGHHFFELQVTLPHGALLDAQSQSLLRVLDQTHRLNGSYSSIDSNSDSDSNSDVQQTSRNHPGTSRPYFSDVFGG